MKKILLCLGTIASVATPIATVISCGTTETPTSIHRTKKSDTPWDYNYVKFTYLTTTGETHTMTLSHSDIAHQYYGDTNDIDNSQLSSAVRLAIMDQMIYNTEVGSGVSGTFRTITGWRPV